MWEGEPTDLLGWALIGCVCHLTCAQVKVVMRQNIEKVAKRGEKLEDLGKRAGEG